MAVDGVMGNGVKLGYAATSPTTWLPVPQVLDVEIPGLVADKVPTTVHGGVYKRNIRGLLDVTPMKVMLLADLDPATTNVSHTALQTLQAAGTTVWWRVEVPSNRARTLFAAFEFQGYVDTWTPSAPIEGRQEIEVNVVFDGTSFTRYAPAATAIT
jgi:hypothetical protein